MPGLALPGEAPANSLAYFGQYRVAPDASVTLFVGAYVKEADSSHLPEVTVSVIDTSFQELRPGSRGGGTLSPLENDSLGQPDKVRGPVCQDDDNGIRRYGYALTWQAPDNPGGYLIALKSEFAVGEGVLAAEKLAHMTVSDQQPAQGYILWGASIIPAMPDPPDASEPVHDQRYNIYPGASGAASPTLYGHIRYQMDSFPDTDLTVNLRGLVDPANVALIDNQTVSLRDLSFVGAQKTTSFTQMTQDGTGRSFPHTAVLGLIRGTNVGGHQYSYEINGAYPLTLRDASNTAVIKVGSYVIDARMRDHGYASDNLGVGSSYTFYANPQAPTASLLPNGAIQLSTYAAPADALGPNTTVLYSFTYHPDDLPPGNDSQDVVCPGAPDLVRTCPGLQPNRRYTGFAAAVFITKSTTGGATDEFPSDPVPSSIYVPMTGATPTDTPTATPPSTDTPSATPPPTDTPTPTPASGSGLLAPRGAAYAWVRTFSADADGARDAFYASTWAHNPHPQSFFWQAGRPLHLLPAVGEHPRDTRLAVHDDGNGNTALLYPRLVTTTAYTVDELGALGGQTGAASYRCGPAAAGDVSYAHVARYPQEIYPDSPRVALVWSPDGLAGTLPPGTVRCDVASILAAHGDATLTLRYTVHQRAVYEAAFATNPPAGTTNDDLCDTVLAPAPTAAPSLSEPPPAFATPGAVPVAVCPAPDVGLGAARALVARWHDHLTADPGVTVTGVRAEPAPGAPAGTLRLTVDWDRAVILSYHIVFTREVNQ